MPALLVCLAVLLLVGCAARAPEAAAPTPLAEGTDRSFRHTMVTTAPPEAIWRLWTDPASWHEWDTELKSATLDGPWEPGARGRLVPLAGPSARFDVTAVAPRATAYTTNLPMAVLRLRRSWTPLAEGQIAVTHEVEFGGLMGGVFASRLGPGFRRALPPVMARLDSLARAQSTAPLAPEAGSGAGSPPEAQSPGEDQ